MSQRMGARGWRALAMVGGSAALLAGCSLFRPYDWYDSKAMLAEQQGAETDLDKAVSYAESVRSEYLSAADTQASLSTIGGTVLIPLGAAGAGLGIVGVGGPPVTAVLTAGAAGYATTSWLRSPTREDAYVVGGRAITCILNTVRPLQSVTAEQRRLLKVIIGGAPGGTGDPESLRKQIGDATTKLADVKNATTAVQDLLPQLDLLPDATDTAKPFIDRANLAGQNANKTIKDAGDSLKSGIDLDAKFSAAAAGVVGGVQAVQDSVNKIVETTIPSLTALPGIIGQIQTTVSSQMPAAPAGAAKGATTTAGAGKKAAALRVRRPPAETEEDRAALEKAQRQKLEAALTSLDGKTTALNGALDNIGANMQTISAMVDTVNAAAKQAPNVSAACLADFSQISTGVTLSPASISTDASDGIWTVTINGGKAPYHLSQEGAPRDDSIVKIDEAKDPQAVGNVFVFKVTVTKPKKPIDKDATYTELVTDSASGQARLTITLKAPEKKDSTTSDNEAAPGEAAPPKESAPKKSETKPPVELEPE